ncbi:MAG: hypothetical protein H6567_12585 [Lewinellaceae bacterium]|nr:hypothetical protein [Lewinellaceae bacterium]
MKNRIVLYFALLSILGIWFAIKLNGIDASNGVDKRCNYLIDQSICPWNSTERMPYMEWDLFAHSFTVFSLSNLAEKDTENSKRYAIAIRKIIENVMSDTLQSYFMFGDSIEYDKWNGSVLYLGHLNMMLGCYRKLANDIEMNELHDQISNKLFDRFSKAQTQLLASYPGQCYIPDNIVALASLQKHHEITGSQYNDACKKWIAFAKENYLDSIQNLLISSIKYDTIREASRGSMISWSILFLSQIDRDFAVQLFERFLDNFCTDGLFIEMCKESSGDFSTGEGDMDSGPLILGYGMPATTFALGCAHVLNKDDVAKKLKRTIYLGCQVIETQTWEYVVPRFLEGDLSFLTNAILLYMETL